MSVTHYVAFVGGGQTLINELAISSRRMHGLRMVSSPVKKGERGITIAALNRAVADVCAQLKAETDPTEFARLSVWVYEPRTEEAFQALWKVFGRSAWVEFVPADLEHKDTQTREYIERRISEIVPVITQVSQFVFAKRRSSPLPLPFSNFASGVLTALKGHWYFRLDGLTISRFLQSVTERFRQMHTRADAADGYAHEDDRGLLFAPTKTEVSHAVPHPVGDNGVCLVKGRFRFGAALFKGFHYDVRSSSGSLKTTFYDCDGISRDLRPEKREYLNVYPSDYLLPHRPK